MPRLTVLKQRGVAHHIVPVLAFVILFGVIGLYFLVYSHAATISHSPGSALPGYCATGGSSLWTNLESCGWPGPANTGPNLSQCPGGKLNPIGSLPGQVIKISTPNATLSCQAITGMLDITAQNVTIKNSTISSNSGLLGQAANGTAGITVDFGATATVDHVAINGNDGVHACIWDAGNSLTANAVDCHDVDDGIFSWADARYSATAGDNFTIQNSYFHTFTHLTSNGHEDGYQTEGAANGLIQHNTYQMDNTADAAVAIWDSRKDAANISVSNNLMTGGGFAAYAQDYNPGDGAPGDLSASGGYSETNITFTNNDFSTYAAACVGKYGVWFTRPTWVPYAGGPTDGWHRSGNTVLESGTNVDNGNYYPTGQNCG